MTAPVVLVGVGNQWRGDDGVGWAVIDALEERQRELGAANPPVELVRADGEAARLIDAWDRRSLAVVVDAVVSGAPAGTIVELRQDDLVSSRAAGNATATNRSWSSHGLGIEDAMALAGALGRMPDQLVLIGVEGRAFDDGETLSPEVAAAVPRVLERIRTLLSEASTCA